MKKLLLTLSLAALLVGAGCGSDDATDGCGPDDAGGAKTLKDTMKDASDAAKDTATDVGDTVKDVANDVKDAAKEITYTCGCGKEKTLAAASPAPS